MLVNTEYFSESARYKLKNGVYTEAPYGSKEYREYWEEEDKRCLQGYTVGGVRITGQHYFFLNFKQLETVKDVKAVASEKDKTFPRFWEAHYKFFHALEEAEIAGKHMCILKPRGSGFSEIMSSVGVYHYTLVRGSKCFYFASNEGYLNKDGVITKCWDHLEFLNAETHKAYRHLRQKKDQDLHKRASMVDPKTGNEYGYKSEIIGRVIDHPRKVRGARTGSRGKVFFEEGGSFPNLKDAVITTRPLVEQGGITTGQIIVWGCLTENNKVWTVDGRYISIKELKQEEGIVGYNGKQALPQSIIGLNPPAEKPCYRIELDNGLHIECSNDHPLLYSNNTTLKARPQRKKLKQVKFIKAELIKPGDQLMVINEIPIFGHKTLLNARLIGLLIGDGNYSIKSGTQICGCDSEILAYIENNYKHVITKAKFNKSDGRLFKAYSLKGLSPQLRALGIYGQTKTLKRLPINIHTYTKNSIAELLGGYFDADGSVRNDSEKGISIVLTSIAKPLLEEVQIQLMKFGIHSTILTETPLSGFKDKKDFRHVIYRLYINRYSSIINFQKHIKLLCKHKQHAIDTILTSTKKLRNVVKQAEFVFDKVTGKGAYFINKKDLQGMQSYTVKSIEYIGLQTIYNLNAGITHTYLANNIITANTGGEKGPGIEGLEHIFYHPDAYNMMSWQNIWDEDRQHTKCCYFIPVYNTMDKYMDENGNALVVTAKSHHEKERHKIHLEDPTAEDKYIAEFPFTPSEALIRLSNNIFPVAELQRQLLKVSTDRNIQGFLKNGWMYTDTTGKPKFRISNTARPITEFPHGNGDNLTGCVTIFESPYKDQTGHVPAGMYCIVVDPYYKDNSESKISLASAYIYKHYNNLSPTEDDIIVGWYTSRPEKLDDFYRQLFMLAEYYNATIQAEIAGGGKGILDYASFHKLKQYCEKEPDIVYNKEVAMKSFNKPYFMNMPADRVQLALAYLSDWLKTERSAINENGEVVMIMNLHKIYDEGLLKELIKFNAEEGNFDRVSAMRLLPFMIKERSNQEYRARQESSQRSFWDREMFSDNNTADPSFQLTQWELMAGVKEEAELIRQKQEAFEEGVKTSYNNTTIYPEDIE